MSFGYLKSQSQTAHDSVVGVQEKIQSKLDDNFEGQDKKAQNAFDIGKLEQIKEKASKNFFENMESLKQKKKQPGKQDDDLLDFDPNDNKQVAQQNTGNDLMDMDFGSNKQTPVVKQQVADPYGGLDLLDAEVQQVSKPKTQDNDLLFDFQQNMNIGNNGPKPSGGLLDDDMFGDLTGGMRAEESKKKDESKSKGQGSDPFDFLAF